MEQDILESQPGLQVDHESRASFRDAAKWGNFISVVYLVCFGLFTLVLLMAAPILFSGNVPAEYEGVRVEQGDPLMRVGQIVMLVFFLIYAGIMLFRFASSCRKGVETQDQRTFNLGLRALRNYFVVTAIYTGIRVLLDLVTLTT
jgi:hypothetical protein